MRKEWKN